MKVPAFILLIFLSCISAFGQQWELKVSGGGNYTFPEKYEQQTENVLPGTTTNGNTVLYIQQDLYHISFTPKAGAYLQSLIFYRPANKKDKWQLNCGLGFNLQRFHQRISHTESKIKGPLYPDGPEANEPFEIMQIDWSFLDNPKLGETSLYYLRPQLGASYLIHSKLAIEMTGWADVRLQSVKYGYVLSNKSSTGTEEGYDKSGAGFKHVVTGLQTGISYLFLPRLSASLSYSRSLTSLYKQAQFVSSGKAYTNQLQLGLTYSLLVL